MKDHKWKIVLYAVCIAALLAFLPANAEVYKLVDEDGNVTYTDRAPDLDAEPIELRGLSVIAPQKPVPHPLADSESTTETAEPEPQEEVTSIRELRKGYRDFAIVSPTQDQNFWGTDNQLTAAWNTRYRLQQGMTVIFYLDGEAQIPTTSAVISLTNVYRGEHVIYAELKDARNRRIAVTEPVTFHMKQYSVNFHARQNQGG